MLHDCLQLPSCHIVMTSSPNMMLVCVVTPVAGNLGFLPPTLAVSGDASGGGLAMACTLRARKQAAAGQQAPDIRVQASQEQSKDLAKIDRSCTICTHMCHIETTYRNLYETFQYTATLCDKSYVILGFTMVQCGLFDRQINSGLDRNFREG